MNQIGYMLQIEFFSHSPRERPLAGGAGGEEHNHVSHAVVVTPLTMGPPGDGALFISEQFPMMAKTFFTYANLSGGGKR